MARNLELRNFETRKTARIGILRPDGKPVAALIALHGYRQLVTYFAPKFQVLADRGVLVIAPEALNRFYIEGYSGRVGATWMTREERDAEINDYLKYLHSVFSAFEDELDGLPVHLLGFSQGGATACRWFADSDIHFASLLLYASVFPNDFDFETQASRLSKVPCVMAFGDEDVFAPEHIIQQKLEWVRSKGIEPELLRFKGGHELHDRVLLAMWDKINAAL
ncbi:MAG: esterase [Salibacteraceae bacterium]